MALKLGSNPKEFIKSVEIVLLNEKVDYLNVTFVYRTRKEFAELLDLRKAEDKAALEKQLDFEKNASEEEKKSQDAKYTVTGMYLDHAKKSAERVLQIAKGWDMVEPFDVEHLMLVEDEFPGVMQAIENKYQKSIAEARVKN